MSFVTEESFADKLLYAVKDGGFEQDGFWVWCGSSILGEDGKFHLFAARWPVEYPFFKGYVLKSEIVHAVSNQPEGPYTFHDVVLPDRGEDFWDGRMTHNPTIVKSGDDYLLFYIGTTYHGPTPKPLELEGHEIVNEAYAGVKIGMARSKSVYGPWERPDVPILLPRPGKWDNLVVTNPAPCVLPSGEIRLYYRSNTPEGLRIGLAGAKDSTSPFERISDFPVTEHNVEDVFVWHDGGGFHMIAKDMDGVLCGEKWGGVHMLSDDGIHWELASNPKAYSRTVYWDDGTKCTLSHMERPQILFVNGQPSCIFFAGSFDGEIRFPFDNADFNKIIKSQNIAVKLK